jgi:hypothetical protein
MIINQHAEKMHLGKPVILVLPSFDEEDRSFWKECISRICTFLCRKLAFRRTQALFSDSSLEGLCSIDEAGPWLSSFPAQISWAPKHDDQCGIRF